MRKHGINDNLKAMLSFSTRRVYSGRKLRVMLRRISDHISEYGSSSDESEDSDGDNDVDDEFQRPFFIECARRVKQSEFDVAS